MDEIKTLLHRSGLSTLKESGLTIVSLYGVSSEKRAGITSTVSTLTIANRIVGSNYFTARNEVRLYYEKIGHKATNSFPIKKSN